jgi:hypothetical protein
VGDGHCRHGRVNAETPSWFSVSYNRLAALGKARLADGGHPDSSNVLLTRAPERGWIGSV